MTTEASMGFRIAARYYAYRSAPAARKLAMGLPELASRVAANENRPDGSKPPGGSINPKQQKTRL
jgi:hypothetical protein